VYKRQNNYTAIQAAVNDASNGDTVFVYDDSSPYYEKVVVNKTIDLIGENRDTTIIDGIGNEDVVYVSSDWVTFSGFTIINGGHGGILIVSDYNTITSNNISNNNYGIVFVGSSNITITGNIISNNGDGIYLDHTGSNFVISDNTITSNNNYGICFFYSSSSNNIIATNNISNNNYGIVFVGSSNIPISGNNIADNNYGIYFYYSSNIIISDNIISNNDDGIVFGGSSNITISDNIISNNDDGIYFYYSNIDNIVTSNNISNNNYGIYLDWHSSSNTIMGNTISNNDNGIYIYHYSNNNIIYHNNFINNTQNAYDEHSNAWDNSLPYGGNYWDDYTGTDADGNGLGDSPYSISGGDSQDLYPLMYPFEIYYVLNISTPPQVDEHTEFTAIVKSIGGTLIPDALVEFRDEVKVTDLNGMAQFTAPYVEEDTIFWIDVTKEGCIGDCGMILVIDMPEFKTTIIFGNITNLTAVGDYTTFEAVNMRCITFFPLSRHHYTSGELITIIKDYFGLVTPSFIFALTVWVVYPNQLHSRFSFLDLLK